MGELPSCPACAARGMQVFFRLEQVPVHQNLLMPTREAAQQCARGDIVLGFCPTCGFISNLAFEPSLLRYSPQYENAQTSSELFRAYMKSLATDLINRYGLYNKKIVEIGCGKGEFLTMLCELGNNRGVGFDPSYVEESSAVVEGVTFIRDYYSERYTNHQADFICCRHVLEHNQYPAELLASLRRSIGERSSTVVFFEVPSVTWILRNVTFWDIFYEHCSYFNPGSLARLFASCGFMAVSIREAFGDQYLWLEALPSECIKENELNCVDDPQETARSIAYFSAHYQERYEFLRHEIDQIRHRRQRCVIWGAGAKGATFLNMLDIHQAFMPYVIDINPRKQGKYIPGTGQRIVSPEFLKMYMPDFVFVMNPNYLDEIRDVIINMEISSKIIHL